MQIKKSRLRTAAGAGPGVEAARIKLPEGMKRLVYFLGGVKY